MNTTTTNPALDKMEGPIIIKRKAFWVKRYAKIENNTFEYRKDKSK